jgi:hypothetical protein
MGRGYLVHKGFRSKDNKEMEKRLVLIISRLKWIGVQVGILHM